MAKNQEIDVIKEFVAIFATQEEAARRLGITARTLRNYLSGREISDTVRLLAHMYLAHGFLSLGEILSGDWVVGDEDAEHEEHVTISVNLPGGGGHCIAHVWCNDIDGMTCRAIAEHIAENCGGCALDTRIADPAS